MTNQGQNRNGQGDRKRRIIEAKDRQKQRDNRTTQQQLSLLSDRTGASKKERKRLS